MTDRQSTRELLERLGRYWPDVSTAESDLVIALIRLNGLVREATDRVLADHDLTPAAFEVLVSLRSIQAPRQLTPTELYRANMLSSGGLTKIINNLSGRKLIDLVSNKEDGRSKKVRLTAKGKRLAEKVTAEVSAGDRALFAGRVAPARVGQLKNRLLEVLDALEAE